MAKGLESTRARHRQRQKDISWGSGASPAQMQSFQEKGRERCLRRRREVSPKAHRRKERQDLGENRTRLALALKPLGGRTGHLRSRAGPAGFKSATGLAGQGLGPRLRRAAAGEVGKDKGPDTSCSARGARHAERGPGDPRGTWAGLCRSNGVGAEPGAKVEVAWRSSEGRRLEITGQSPLAFWEIVAASWAEPQSRRPARFDHGGRQHLSSSE